MEVSIQKHKIRNLSVLNTNNAMHYMVLFIVWPFLAFLVAMFNYKEKIARKVVYMFLVYYGLTFVVGSMGMDAYEYVRRFQINAELPFSAFMQMVSSLYTDTSIDILEPLISFIVSRFTANYGFLFAAYAAVFGFFYLKTINKLYYDYRENPGINSLVFLLFFGLIIPFTSINAPRMWTAAWIFLYGAYHVVQYRKLRYLLISFSACLMHWSFLSANLILLIYVVLGNRNLIYFILAGVSFVIPDALMSLFENISMKVGGAIEGRFTGYTNEEYNQFVQDSWEQASWFLGLSKSLIFYFLLIVILIIYFFYNKEMTNRKEKNLFSFTILFLSFVNFGKPIPAFGERFQIVFMLFATLYIFYYFMHMKFEKLHPFTLIGIFPMLLFIAVEFRVGSESINALLFSPGFGLPLFTEGISIAELFFH